MDGHESCIADFNLRKKTRLKYPGACSLEYQNVMNIIIESLFQWDIKKQKSKGPGIFGTTVAFAPADEEQGRKTLHKHIQLWVREIDQQLRTELFANDISIRTEARQRFQRYIDKIMCASYGVDMEMELPSHPLHCDTPSTLYKPDQLYDDASSQRFRDARHEELCVPINGRIIQPKGIHQLITPDTIINRVLTYWKNVDRPDTILPPTKEKLDQAAYLFSYHMKGGCNESTDEFWGDHRVRQLLLTHRFDHHDYTHRRGCFKKGCECRFLFPFRTCRKTYIHEDIGEKEEHVVTWPKLFGESQKIAPWMVIPKRPMGCQYINVHNHTLSSVLNCNTNVQVGDPFHMYYITLYNLKSTQEEDSERTKRIAETIIRRLIRIQDEARQNLRDEHNDDSFVEGLCRMLGGLNAATSRYVVSSTMAHLLISQGGTRFKFSHGMSDLLIGQLEACLEGKPVDVRLRINSFNKERIIWRDCLADDYIHRPIDPLFETMCSYQMAMKYKKKYMSFKQMNKLNNNVFDGHDELEDDSYDYSPVFQAQFKTDSAKAFRNTHPGFKFSHLEELEHFVIPKISFPKDRLCNIEELQIGQVMPDDHTSLIREEYAKIALLMFYPYRTLEDLKLNNSYWNLFMREHNKHLNGRETKFWKKGFEILQNIQDRLTLQKEVKRARDPITLNTSCQKPSDNTSNKQSDCHDETPDILEFCPQDR